MSNPSVAYLVRTKINGIYFAVEDNLGEAIHIHYAGIRIDMSVSEFMKFSDCVINAVREMFSIRGLDFDIFDIESIKEEWLENYKSIASVDVVDIPLEALFMKESYVKQRSIKRIIPVKESGYIPYYKGESQDKEYYDVPGIYEPSRGEKAFIIEKKIKGYGYPYDNKRILIDQDGYILDGLKRASCLYYLYGGNYNVSAIQINISWNQDLLARRNEAEQAIKLLEGNENHVIGFRNSSELNETKIVAYNDLFDRIRKMNIEYMYIQGNANNELGIYAIVMFKGDCYDLIRENICVNEIDESAYRKYYFAYAMNKPLVCLTERGYILFHDRYIVKSKFMNDVMVPLDKMVQRWMWENRKHRKDIELFGLDEHCEIVINIIHFVLEGIEISDAFKRIIKSNKKLLCDVTIKKILETVFFKYTDYLLQCLINDKFDLAVNDYINYAEY